MGQSIGMTVTIMMRSEGGKEKSALGTLTRYSDQSQ